MKLFNAGYREETQFVLSLEGRAELGWQRKGALEVERRASECTTVQWAVGVMGERRLTCAECSCQRRVGRKQAGYGGS